MRSVDASRGRSERRVSQERQLEACRLIREANRITEVARVHLGSLLLQETALQEIEW